MQSAQAVHPCRKRADAGQNQLAGAFNFARVGGDACRRAEMLECFLHRAEIAKSVVNNGNHWQVANG